MEAGDPQSGRASEPRLFVKERLDRESRGTYSALLTAYDGGVRESGIPPRSGTMNIVIVVLDANDNAPTFGRPMYNATVREDFPVGGIVLFVDAHDADEGINSQVNYDPYSINIRSYYDFCYINIKSYYDPCHINIRSYYDPCHINIRLYYDPCNIIFRSVYI